MVGAKTAFKKIIIVLLFLNLLSCSVGSINRYPSAEIISDSFDVAGNIRVEIKGYPPFLLEVFDNPYFEGSPFLSETSQGPTYTFTGPISAGTPYYIRTKSPFGEWQNYCGESGNLKKIYMVSGSEGTMSNPYIIGSANDLIFLSERDSKYGGTSAWSSYYILEEDIDLSGVNWKPIGREILSVDVPFSGSFNGNGHIISGLQSIDSSSSATFAGLFGHVDNGQIKRLGLKTGNIVCSNSVNVGGLIGYLGGSASQVVECYVEGEKITSLFNGGNTGGLIGNYQYSPGLVLSDCYSDIDVEGRGDVGGFVGRTFVTGPMTTVPVSSCYSSGNVLYSGLGTHYVGGFAGILTGGGLSIHACTAFNSSVTNKPGSNGTLSRFALGAIGINLLCSEVYFNRSMVNPGGSIFICNDGAIDHYAEPINIFTMNSSSLPFSLGGTYWNFTETWKWDDSHNRPKLRKVK